MNGKAITQQPLKGLPIPSTSHFGYLSSGDKQTPGQTEDITRFPGVPFDGTNVSVSQQISHLGAQDKDETKTSEEDDFAAIHVEIDWKEKDLPSKWETTLRKALQTLFNRNFQIPSLTLHKLHILETPFSAKLIIHPSSACEALLETKSAPLKFKDYSEATVHFRMKVPLEEPSPIKATFKQHEISMQQIHQIPMTVSVEVDAMKYGHELAQSLLDKFAQHRSGHTITVKGTFEEVDNFYQQFRQVVGYPVAMNANSVSEHTNSELTQISREPMRVPLIQYWYLNHMHRKDIESIEEKHGVKFEADVCVSVQETLGPNNKSFRDATQEFEKLFLKHTCDICNAPVPNAVEFAREIQSLDVKLMLNGSFQNWSLVGPRDHVNSAQKIVNGDLKNDAERSERIPRDKTQIKTAHSWDGPKGIEMNIKDPVLNDGIHISNTHWEIMKIALKKQIKNLENKFGVVFQEHPKNIHGNISVTAQSPINQIVNLEINAMRALMSLYQKVVMSTISCPLQNGSHHQSEKVKKYLDELREQNPSLVIVEGSDTNGVLMLIGLPDHLRFAVREIEKKLGGPTFDKKHKEMIGYDRYVEFMRPFTDGPSWEGSKLNEGMGWGKGAASGGVDNESINASRAYKEIERGAGGRRAHESSVDGPASSSFFGQDGQKPGGVGRKEMDGFGNDKQRQTEAGFNGRSHDERTAQPVEADGGGTNEDDKCPICMDEFTNKEKLPCGHGFCKDCLRQSVESMGAKCPVCTKVFGKIEGDQPYGTMRDYTMRSPLPGFERCGTIVIEYNIPSGKQSSKHPKPGQPFRGAQRTAYLPDNNEGREVLALLRRAFDQKLIFTVGTSRTMGTDDCVTWNDVHHKTSTSGGAQSFGYPDSTYLKRVREELKAKGIE